MARKRVEEEAMPEMEYQTEKPAPANYVQAASEPKEKEPINCLRNERVIVRFVPSQNAMVQSRGHVLWGGMAETATRSFVVPRLRSTGVYKNVLTNNEKACLEKVMGLEPDALSVHRRTNNFWSDANPNGMGKVTLHKQDNFLDLSNPIDYIKYKILLANTDYIAPSLQDLEDRPKATYQFVIISENAETQANLSKMDATMRCYMEYGKIEKDKDTLRLLIETFEGRPMGAQVKLDYLQGKVNEFIQKDPRRFLNIAQDELLPIKVLIRKSVDAGLIGKRNDTYYLTEDNRPLCELGEDSTLTNAAKYISSVKRAELKYSLEAKLKVIE